MGQWCGDSFPMPHHKYQVATEFSCTDVFVRSLFSVRLARGNFLNTREHMRSSSPIWIWLELYTGMHVPLCVFVLASDVHYFLPEQELSKPWQIIYKDLANR